MFKKTLELINFALLPIYRNIVDNFVHLVYKLTITGFEKIPKEGAALLISNHVSYVDGLIIQAACTRPVRFVIDKYIYEIPLVNYFMKLDRGIPIAPNHIDVKAALAEIDLALKNGEIVCIFPEGELTHSGLISKFKPGTEWILAKTPVDVYPIALRGLWGSVLSRKFAKKHGGLWPKQFRMSVSAMCGDAIAPNIATIDYLQRAVMQLYDQKNEDPK